jgi:hypothetical protein
MAAIVLLLAAGAQFAMSSGLDLPKVPRAAAHADAADARPVIAYRAIMAHPLFAADRTPPEAEVDAGNLNGVEVLGTAIAGKNSAALVRDSDGTFTRVKAGEEVEGWKLVSIEPQQLVFDRNGERRTLIIDVARLKTQAPSDGKTKPGMAGSSANGTSNTTASDDSDDSDDDQ